MRTSYNKKFYLIFSIVLLIGLICGIIFVFMLDEASKEIIFLNINEMIQTNGNINNILSHTIFLSLLFILSLCIIGAPFIIFNLFYNGFSLGFIISTLTYIFGVKGLAYSIIYIFISKGVYLFLLFIINNNLFKLIKCNFNNLFYKERNKDLVVEISQKVIILIIFVLVSDFIIYFGGSKLINIFKFLII